MRLLTLLFALSAGCAARRGADAAGVVDQYTLVVGWAYCSGAPGPCTGKLLLVASEQAVEGACYSVVARAPAGTDPFPLEVYQGGDPDPIAESGGQANPVKADFCLEAQDPPRDIQLKIYVPERVPEGVSLALFRRPS